MRILTLLFLALFVFSACSDDDNPASPPLNPNPMDLTMTFNVGDVRIYKSVVYNLNQEIVKVVFDTLTFTAVRDFEFNGEQVKLYTSSENKDLEEGMFQTKTTIYSYKNKKDGSLPKFTPEIYMEKTVKEGDKIINRVTQEAGKSYFLVQTVDIKTTFHNYTYNCCKINVVAEKRPEMIAIGYFSKKYGLNSISIAAKNPITGQILKISTRQLISHDIK